VLIYQTATNDDAIHLATPDAGLDGTWQPQGACIAARNAERGAMTAGMVSLGYAVFLATAILSFVGAFIMIMTARIVTRLFTMHR